MAGLQFANRKFQGKAISCNAIGTFHHETARGIDIELSSTDEANPLSISDFTHCGIFGSLLGPAETQDFYLDAFDGGKLMSWQDFCAFLTDMLAMTGARDLTARWFSKKGTVKMVLLPGL